MAFGRRQHNLTLLADGSVLATGGNSTGASLIDMNGGVFNAERWDPATGKWTTLAAQAVTRQYHSTALLLPDGRVLSSGGGICGLCDQVGYLAKNAEIFTPPYLFKHDGSGELAPRPELTDAPSTVHHGASFHLTTPSAASIQKVGLMRLGSQTHSVEMEQRYVPLSFTAGAGTLTASVPANVNTAVPGVYMLFIVDSAGVPSVARMVNLDNEAPPPPADTQPLQDTQPPQVTQPPHVTLRGAPQAIRLRGLLRRGIRLTLTPSEPVSFRASLLASARSVRIARNRLTLTSRSLGRAGGTRTLGLRPKRRLLRNAPRRFRIQLVVQATDAVGLTRTLRRTIRVRR